MRATITRHGQSQTTASPCVVALLVDQADTARLSAALRPLRARVVTTVRDLRRAVCEDEPNCFAVISVAYDKEGEPVGTVLRAIAAALPRVPLLGYCGASAREADCLRELAHAGVHELVFRDVDDQPALLRRRIGTGEETRAAVNVLSMIRPVLAATLWPLARHVVQYPRAQHSVLHVAAALGVHRKTLLNWTERAHAPPPRALIVWCRLLLAAELLQSPGRSVEHVSDALEFASASALGNLCRRYLGATPTELRKEPALRRAYDAFERALEGADRTRSVADVSRPESSTPGLHLSPR